MRLIQNIERYGVAATIQAGVNKLRLSVIKRKAQRQKLAFVKTAYGVELASSWGDTTFEACVKGHYGVFLSRLLSSIPEPFVFLDIGANQGLYSLIAATNSKCVKVLSFEPVANTFKLLAKNVNRSHRSDVITPLNFALSSESGQADIWVNSTHSGVASLHNTGDEGNLETIRLQTFAALDSYLDGIEGMPIYVKVDTEGHEQVILDELAACSFASDIHAVFYEVDEEWTSYNDLSTAAKAIGLSNIEKVGRGSHYDVLATRS